MKCQLVKEQTPAEYFKELVEEAIKRQQVHAEDLTAYYLVNLLCQFVRPHGRYRLVFSSFKRFFRKNSLC